MGGPPTRESGIGVGGGGRSFRPPSPVGARPGRLFVGGRRIGRHGGALGADPGASVGGPPRAAVASPLAAEGPHAQEELERRRGVPGWIRRAPCRPRQRAFRASALIRAGLRRLGQHDAETVPRQRWWPPATPLTSLDGDGLRPLPSVSALPPIPDHLDAGLRIQPLKLVAEGRIEALTAALDDGEMSGRHGVPADGRGLPTVIRVPRRTSGPAPRQGQGLRSKMRTSEPGRFDPHGFSERRTPVAPASVLSLGNWSPSNVGKPVQNVGSPVPTLLAPRLSLEGMKRLR